MKLVPRSLRVVLALAATTLLPAVGCSDSFGQLASTATIQVKLLPPSNPGTRKAKLPVTIDQPIPFTVKVTMLRLDGSIDSDFDGYVRIGVKPGNVQSISGPGTDGRNVRLKAGVSEAIVVNVVSAFGETRIIADDLGHIPADPLDPKKKPACSDGIDNDGDGAVDAADFGCAFPNDDSEESGTNVAGASEPIFFELPRIKDVRGIHQGGAITAYPQQQIQVDTGYDSDTDKYKFTTVVTRISSDGFYVTDLEGQRTEGFSSVFAFNFNAPPEMRVCDRLTSLGGTAVDFFGFTEISFPTWTLEAWSPKKGACPVPEPAILGVDQIGQNQVLVQNIASMVRVQTEGDVETRVAAHFGAKDMPTAKNADGKDVLDPVTGDPVYTPGDDASNCDLNKDGKIDFEKNPEKACANACEADPECSEWSDFAGRSTFNFVVHDKARDVKQRIQGDGSVSAAFSAVALRGKPLRAFTGTLKYFSGGAQYTIEARCAADIVVDLKDTPKSSQVACIPARTDTDSDESSN